MKSSAFVSNFFSFVYSDATIKVVDHSRDQYNSNVITIHNDHAATISIALTKEQLNNLIAELIIYREGIKHD